MRIFVTGASGWIGSAVVLELLGAGHEVVGLARSDESAQRLETSGALVRRGDLDDPDGLAKAANDSDGVIHLAFQHEVAWSGDFAAAGAADRRAVEAMGVALADSDRPLVLASGMVGRTSGRVATENDGLVPSAEVRANPAGRGRHRPAHAVLAGRRLRSSVLRSHRRFTVTATTGSWPRSWASPDGGAWPDTWGTRKLLAAVHRSDAARLARLAVDSAPAGSSCTPWGTRVSRSPRSPRSWAGISTSRRRVSRRPMPPNTSPTWATSSLWTAPPPPSLPGRCSDGSRPGSACSTISTRTTTTVQTSELLDHTAPFRCPSRVRSNLGLDRRRSAHVFVEDGDGRRRGARTSRNLSRCRGIECHRTSSSR